MSRPRIDAIMIGIDRLLVVTSALFLLLAVLIVTANVASRYALHLSLAWSAELARYATVWSALLAATVLVIRHQHLAVELPGKAGGRQSRFLGVVMHVGSMTFFMILTISGAILVRDTAGQTASSMGALPISVVYSIVPLSGALMSLGSFANLLRTLDPDSVREGREEGA